MKLFAEKKKKYKTKEKRTRNERNLLMIFLYRDKARILRLQHKINNPYRAVPLFGNDQFSGNAFNVRHRLIFPALLVFRGRFPVEEHHKVGILFYRAGIPEIRQRRLLPVAGLLRIPVKLAESDNGYIQFPREAFQRSGNFSDLLVARQFAVLMDYKPDIINKYDLHLFFGTQLTGLGTKLMEFLIRYLNK